MRKLCIIIPIWGRGWLSNHLLNYYHQFDNSRTEYMIVVVGSEGRKSERLARGLTYIERGNEPLDRKYDEGFLYCKQFNPDAVTLVGSDDFITQNYFEWSLDQIARGTHYVGILDFFLADIRSNQIHYWGGYSQAASNSWTGAEKGNTIGAARVFSKFILDKIEWAPFVTEGKGHFHWHQDDEGYADDQRAENKIESAISKLPTPTSPPPLQIKTTMENVGENGCRYWAVKTGEEINPTTSFFLEPENLVNTTTREQFSLFFSDTGFPSALMGDSGGIYPDGTAIWTGVDWVK